MSTHTHTPHAMPPTSDNVCVSVLLGEIVWYGRLFAMFSHNSALYNGSKSDRAAANMYRAHAHNKMVLPAKIALPIIASDLIHIYISQGDGTASAKHCMHKKSTHETHTLEARNTGAKISHARFNIFYGYVWLLMAIIILIDASKDMLVTWFFIAWTEFRNRENEKNETTRRANNKYIHCRRRRCCAVVVFIIVAPVAISPFPICTPCSLHFFFLSQLWNVKITIRFPYFRSLENWINTHISALMRFHFALLIFITPLRFMVPLLRSNPLAAAAAAADCFVWRAHINAFIAVAATSVAVLSPTALVYWFTAFMPSVDFKYILMQIYRFMRNRCIVSHSFYLDLTCV